MGLAAILLECTPTRSSEDGSESVCRQPGVFHDRGRVALPVRPGGDGGVGRLDQRPGHGPIEGLCLRGNELPGGSPEGHQYAERASLERARSDCEPGPPARRTRRIPRLTGREGPLLEVANAFRSRRMACSPTARRWARGQAREKTVWRGSCTPLL